MGANRMMMSAVGPPPPMRQLTTRGTLKKTPKKKKDRVKRSLKEFERGKGGESPKFRLIVKGSKDDDKANRKRKIKWNVEPHYTVMRKAVGLALDGKSTTRVAQEFGIPARTLRRYVATAKKADGLPETAATDRPTHAPSKKKKKTSSLKSDSGFFGTLAGLNDSYDSDDDEDNMSPYGRIRSNSLDMLLQAAADKRESASASEGPSLMPNDPSGAWPSDDYFDDKGTNRRRQRSGSLDVFFQALGSDLRTGERRDSAHDRGLSFDIPDPVRDQIAKSVPAHDKSRPRNNSLWSPTLTIS